MQSDDVYPCMSISMNWYELVEIYIYANTTVSGQQHLHTLHLSWNSLTGVDS